ncbi:MAG TPA: hypothetical protein VH186_34285 [Chloroflexia bacterium]|nr:hypothetical protein [Chloroflexia bacterium]
MYKPFQAIRIKKKLVLLKSIMIAGLLALLLVACGDSTSTNATPLPTVTPLPGQSSSSPGITPIIPPSSAVSPDAPATAAPLVTTAISQPVVQKTANPAPPQQQADQNDQGNGKDNGKDKEKNDKKPEKGKGKDHK